MMGGVDYGGPGKVSVEWAGASVCGSRKEPNQDVWAVIGGGGRRPVQGGDYGRSEPGPLGMVFAVSDGMGGGEGGGVASEFVMSQLSERMGRVLVGGIGSFDCEEVLAHVFRQIHGGLEAKGNEDEELRGMGATLVLGWLCRGVFYVANLGDSRMYRSRGGVTEQLSKDFTFAWRAWKRGEICEVEYRQHPRRAALYGALGGGQGGCMPFICGVEVEKGDRFLLCSDGVVDGLWERKLGMYLGHEGSIEEVCERLFGAAVEGAGADDTTALVVQVS